MQKIITAAAVGLAGTALAVNPTVGHLITGKDVKNNSITSADIKNHSLRIKDFRYPQTITGSAGANGAQGTAGADGAAGTNGTNGINGADGLDGASGTNGTDGANGTNGTDGANGTNGVGSAKIVTWTVHYRAGQTNPTITSNDTIPAGTAVSPVNLQVTDTHNTTLSVQVSLQDPTNNLYRDFFYWDTSNGTRAGNNFMGQDGDSALLSDTPITMFAYATDGNGNGNIPVGDFDAVLTLAETDLSGAATDTIG